MFYQARSQVDALGADVLSRAWEAGVDEGAQVFDMQRCRLDPGQADVGGKVKLLHTVVLYSVGIVPPEVVTGLPRNAGFVPAVGADRNLTHLQR